MDVGVWLGGYLLFVVEVVAIALGAASLRRRLAPAHTGPHGALVTAVLGVSAVLLLGQVLGTAGALARWPFLAATVAFAVIATAGARVRRRREEPTDGVPADERTPTAAGRVDGLSAAALAVGVGALVTAWVARIVSVYRIGSSDGDSLMYHLPFADQFVRTGRTTSIPDVAPTVWVSVYPANVELTSAVAMLPFHHEALVPLLNLGWLALALLAAWCVGDAAGRGPLACLIGAAVLASPVVPATQGGTARVDLAVIALILSAAAILLHTPVTWGSCLAAGLALGFALGAKFTVVALGGALLVAAAVGLWRQRSLLHAASFVAGTALTGSYWYVRNWAATGSPLPMLGIEVPGIVRPFPRVWTAGLDGTSVGNQLGTRGFVHHTLVPAFELVAGSTAMVVVCALVLVVGSVALARRRPVELVHLVAVAGLIGAAVYVVAPNGAPVEGFATTGMGLAITALNMRYLLPALTLLLVLVPFALGNQGRRSDAVAGAAIAAYVVYLCAAKPLTAEWPLTGVDVAVAVAVVGLCGAAVAAAFLVGRPVLAVAGRGWVGVGAVLIAVPVALAPAARDHFADLHRYASSPPEQRELWDHARAHGNERIAVLGDWLQHQLVVPDLHASTAYLATPTDRGVVVPALTCPRMVAALRGGGFDRVVVQTGLMGVPEGLKTSYQQIDELAARVEQIPQARVVFRGPAGLVVDLPDRIPPAGRVCGDSGSADRGP